MYNNIFAKKFKISLPLWTIIAPVFGIMTLGVNSDAENISTFLSIFFGVALIICVLAAVHHAEVIAHKVGEPFGTIILALAITVIEVSLIVSLMLSESNDEPSTLARDTVFAAIMVIITGIIGICLLVGSYRYREQSFIKKGVSTALTTLVAIAVLTLVLPNYTTSDVEGVYSNSQLIFVAIISLVLYGGFIMVQTIRHREFFLSQQEIESQVKKQKLSEIERAEIEIHGEIPNLKTTLISLVLLFMALVVVVLLSKKLSPTIEEIVYTMGAPKSLVGIIIALVILLPEGLAAYRAARMDRIQTSLNLALGSALASIGLTIPAVAIVCYFSDMKVTLGIDAKSTVLLILSLFVVSLSLNSGKTNIQKGVVLLVIFAAYLFLTVVP
ncbi:ionic transporter y4hA [Flavobacterium agricola]|uniref:Ionic transporter y4hA n=1 Tax=Flavobacterium agricola TaxID=2870839 RepID=A0ABY6M2W3_9FLAO|nr:ionic transporter y4hA [Flavobacterium agricola]UYW01506.1 ionic transporter y4hA [Flavobacterium agricola]